MIYFNVALKGTEMLPRMLVHGIDRYEIWGLGFDFLLGFISDNHDEFLDLIVWINVGSREEFAGTAERSTLLL